MIAQSVNPVGKKYTSGDIERCGDITSELESIARTLQSLLVLANQEICNESSHGLSVLSAAQRYAADILIINERLIAHHATHHAGGSQ